MHEMMKTIRTLLFIAVLGAGCATQPSTGDYRTQVPIELPPSAEALLLRHQKARCIINVGTMVYQRKNYADFLVVSGTILLTRGPFAGWFHQDYVFEKDLKKKDWSEATLYCFRNRDDGLPVILPDELLSRPEQELRKYLIPAPIWE